MAKAELGSLGRDFNHAGGAGIGIQRETALSSYFLAPSPTPHNLEAGTNLGWAILWLVCPQSGGSFRPVDLCVGAPAYGARVGLSLGFGSPGPDWGGNLESGSAGSCQLVEYRRFSPVAVAYLNSPTPARVGTRNCLN